MADAFAFHILARDGAARLGEIVTPRGTIRTPAFMPVGTAGTVKAMYAHEVEALGADIVLGNTYHLMLQPRRRAHRAARAACTRTCAGPSRFSPIPAASR